MRVRAMVCVCAVGTKLVQALENEGLLLAREHAGVACAPVGDERDEGEPVGVLVDPELELVARRKPGGLARGQLGAVVQGTEARLVGDAHLRLAVGQGQVLLGMHHLQLGVQARHGLVAQRNAAPFSSPPHKQMVTAMHDAKMSERKGKGADR